MKMINIKSVKYFLIASLMLSSTVGCEERLEEEAFSVITPSNYYTSPKQGYQALLGIMANMSRRDGAFARDAMFVVNLRSDDHNLGRDIAIPGRAELDFYTTQPTNQLITQMYLRLYQVVFRANSTIDGLENASYGEQDNLRLEQIAEAKFYRAWAYFYIVRLFGKATIITSADGDAIAAVGETPRSSVDEVYNQIVEDFTDAMNGLPAKANLENVERPAAMAAASYLSKVHLTIENYTEAAALASRVIESGEYALYDNYEDNFTTVNDGGLEYIYGIAHGGDFSYINIQVWWSPLNFPPENGGKLPINKEVLMEFDTERDLRFNATFRRNYEDIPLTTEQLFTTDEIYISSNKWSFDPNGERTMNYPMFRFSEVLLIYAEAVNEGGSSTSLDKFEAINRVRRRAGLDELSGLSTDEFRAAVRKERRLELVSEGKRYFDLLRWGTLIDEVNEELTSRGLPANAQAPRDLLLPLPQNELDVYPALSGDQNPGY